MVALLTDSLVNRIAHVRLGQSNGVPIAADAPAVALVTRLFTPSLSIHDLPPEVLLENLSLCGLPDCKRPNNDALASSLQISSVCRLWRQLSLECSDIWARCFHAVDTSRQRMDMVLQRVKNNHINFALPALRKDVHPVTREIIWPSMVEFWQTSQYADLLDRAIAQSRSFSVRMSPADAQILQWGPIKQRLSQLDKISLELNNVRECLVLNHCGLYDTETRARWNTRSLNLVRCFFPLNPTFFLFLQDLSVSGLDPAKAALTPQSWLNILAELPHVRQLTLEDAMTDSEVRSVSSAETDENSAQSLDLSGVKLPCLQWLKIRSRFHHMADLVSRLVVPATCNVNIDFHSLWEINTPTFNSFVTWIQNRYSEGKASLGPSVMLRMAEFAFSIFNNTAPVFDLHGEFMREYGVGGAILHEVGFTPDELFLALLASFQMPCQYITELRLYIEYEFHPEAHQNFWKYAFLPFVSVESLWLLSHDSFCFMVPMCKDGGLVECFPSEQGRWQTRFLLPNLRSLTTEGVNFFDPISASDNVSLGTRLLNLVKERKKARREKRTNAFIKQFSIYKGDTGKTPTRAEQQGLMAYSVRVLQ